MSTTSSVSAPSSPTSGPLPLRVAVAQAIEALTDLRIVPGTVLDGRLEEMLRSSLGAYESRRAASVRVSRSDTPEFDGPAGAAVRAACAHLATRALEDAYLALRTASDHLSDRFE